MGIMTPTDPDGGWSAWDYSRAILHELRLLNEQEDNSPDPPVSRIRRGFVIQCDAAGNGQVNIGLPAGVAWNLLAYAWQTLPASAAGYVAFYRDVEEGTGLIMQNPAAAILTGQFNPDGHFIPEQSTLLVVARGIGANTLLSGNVTAKGILNAVPRTTHASADL